MEWIYRYIIKTPWFTFAVLKSKFRNRGVGESLFHFAYKTKGNWRIKYIFKLGLGG